MGVLGCDAGKSQHGLVLKAFKYIQKIALFVSLTFLLSSSQCTQGRKKDFATQYLKYISRGKDQKFCFVFLCWRIPHALQSYPCIFSDRRIIFYW